MGVRGQEVGMGALGWEYGDGSMGMWAWRREHDDTAGQISQISIVWYVGQITQISIGQSASLWILCYCSIGVSWMVPCQLLWINSFTFHDVLLTAFCHHYFGCIFYLIVYFVLFVICSYLFHSHCMLLRAVLGIVFELFFCSMVWKLSQPNIYCCPSSSIKN